MPRETLSPRERWLAVFKREKPDRVPMDFWGTDETVSALMKHTGCATRRAALEKLHVDFAVKLEPRYAGPALAPGLDAFGRLYKKITYETGAPPPSAPGNRPCCH